MQHPGMFWQVPINVHSCEVTTKSRPPRLLYLHLCLLDVGLVYVCHQDQAVLLKRADGTDGGCSRSELTWLCFWSAQVKHPD